MYYELSHYYNLANIGPDMRCHMASVGYANARYWYCDVIFVDCHCMRKLAQRRSALVNNSRE